MGAKFSTIQTQSITSTGGQEILTPLDGAVPRAAIIFSTYSNPISTITDHARMSIGVATALDQYVWCGRGRDSSGTTQTRRVSNSGSIVQHLEYNGNTLTADARLSSFVPDGLRLDWVTPPPDPVSLFIILISGDDVLVHAGVENLLNTMDLEIDVTDPGFRPDFLFLGGGSNLFDGTVEQDYRCSFGIAVNGGNQYGQYFEYPANTGSGTAEAETFTNRVAADRTNYTVEVDNFDADGFSLFARGGGGLDHDIAYLAISLGFGSYLQEFTYDTPTATGPYQKTGIGFTPDFVFLGTNMLDARDSYTTDLKAGANGFASVFTEPLPSRDFAGMVTNEVGAGTTNCASLMDSRVTLNQHDRSIGIQGDLISLDAVGFTIDYSYVMGSARKWWGFAVNDPPGRPRTQVSWAAFEVGDPVPDARGNVSWAEFEVPEYVPCAGQVSWAALKTPDVHGAGSTCWVSWGLFEVPDSDSAIITQVSLETPDPRRRGRVSWATVQFDAPPGEGTKLIRVYLKDFNRDLVLEELDAYGLRPDILFALAGFEPLDSSIDSNLRVWTPSSNPDPYYNDVDVEVGEIWLEYSYTLTAQNIADIELVLYNHNAGYLTEDQQEYDQDVEDRATLQQYLDNPCASLTPSEQTDALCRIMRLLLRYHPHDLPTFPDEYDG